MSNTSIIPLFNQWHDYRRTAWQKTPDTNKLLAGLNEIEASLAEQVPANKQEAFIQLTFIHNLWWENVGHYPLEGRHIALDNAFRSALQYLKEQAG